ncbi:MAG TPA: DUF4836 family protein [Chitinophagaceae bacterium]|jgi:hypothetical protein
MKIRPLIAISTVCITTFFTACKHADKSGILAPKDVLMLVHIDGGSLSSKLSWEDIKGTAWFKDAYGSAEDSLQKKLMDNPENSGIDAKSNFAFFVKKQGAATYIALEGSLKDTTAFLAFNKKVNKDGTSTRDGDVSHMRLNDMASVTWNESRFIYLFATPSMNFMQAITHSAPSESSEKFPVDSLDKFGKGILDISGSDNIASDDRFSTMMGEAGDVHVFVNSEEYFNNFIGGALSMMKLNVLYEGAASATTINFDNGKITMKMKGYYNKDMAKLMDKYPSHAIGADVINRIPSKNVAAAFVFNYPPEGLKELLKMTGVDGIVNSGFEKINYSMDEFVKANKGDIVLAVSDLQMKTKEIPMPGMDGQPGSTYKSTTPDAKILFAASINDKPAFDKLITSLKGLLQQYAPNGIPDVNYTLNNNWFAAGNSQDDINKFISGGGSSQPFADKISGHAFGGYIDLQKIIGMGNDAASSDSSAKAAMDVSLKMWQDVTMYGDASTGSYGEVNLVDKNTNSLKQLNQYIDKIATIVKAKNKSAAADEMHMGMMDSTAVKDEAMPKH